MIDKRYFYGLIIAFAFLAPISAFLAVRVLMVPLLLSFFASEGNQGFFGRWFRRSWDILLYFIILLVGITYSEDKSNALGVIETNLSLFAMTIIAAKLPDFDDDTRNGILRAFTIGVFVSAIICIVYATYRYLNSGDVGVFFYYELTDVIQSHPTYTAYFIIFAMTYLLAGYSSGQSRLSLFQLFTINLFLFVVLLLTGGRTAFVSMLLLIAFFCLRFFIDEHAYRKEALVAFSVFMLVVMIAVSKYGGQRINGAEVNDSWERFDLWRSTWIAAKDHPILGVGTGDYRTELNKYFHDHGMEDFEKGSFNAHNQFLHQYFTNGLLGLISLLLLIGRPLYLSVRRGSAMGVLVFFPLIIYGLTEVFLGRLQGVLFVAILHQSFVAYFDSKQRVGVLKA